MADETLLNSGAVSVEVIRTDGSIFIPLRAGAVSAEVIGIMPGELRVGAVSIEYLHVPVPLALGAVTMEVLGQKREGAPAYVDTTVSAVTSLHGVPPVAEVISPEDVLSATSYAVSAQSYGNPQSYSRVQTTAMLSVLGCPVTVISTESVAQAMIMQLMTADIGAYLRPDDYFSSDDVGQQVILVLQSMDIPYTPTSGVSVRANWSLAVQSSPMGRLPRSNVYAAQQLSQVVQPKPEPMPRSDTNVAQQLTQAVIPAVFEDNTVGVEHVGSVTAYHVRREPLPMHLSYVRAGSATSLVLANDPDSQQIPLSVTRVKSVAAMQLEKSFDVPVQSLTRVPVVHSYAAVQVPTIPPINMLVWSRADAVVSLVAAYADDYPDPNIPTAAAEAHQLTSVAACGTHYDSPADMYEASKIQMAWTVRQLSTRARPLPVPLSYTAVPQFWEYATRIERMPTPEEVLNSGIHIRLITQPIAFAAEYPDATVPYSYLSTGQVMEHVAQVAEYPDVHVPTADAIASQILEHVASPDDFPDPAEMFRPLLVNQVVEHYAAETLYPDANTLHKPVSVWQVAQQVSTIAVYPDKDIPQSKLNVYQVSEQVAVITKYPDKNTPQSTLRADMILEHVMAVDPTLYGMPAPPRKHRVQISCRFVYM